MCQLAVRPFFPAECAVTFGNICRGPLDLVDRALFESTLGSVGTGLRVSKADILRMPYYPQKVQSQPLFVIFPPFAPSHFCWVAFRAFNFFISLVLMILCASLIMLSLMTSFS